MREYSQGGVKPYIREGRSPKWHATIKEGITREVTDSQGHPIMMENGTPKTEIKRRTLQRTFGDIECTPYKYRGQVRYRGQREAEEALRQWREELVRLAKDDYDAAVAADDERAKAARFSYAQMGVKALLDGYLDECEAYKLEPSTLEGYRYSAKRSTNHFGDMPVGELTCDDLKAFDLSMIEEGLSSTTRSKTLKVLKAAYDAHRDHIGSDYPFARSKVSKWWPSPKQADPNPLDKPSIAKVLSDINETGPTPFMCAVEIALRTGARIGGICALRWSDIDRKTGDMTIRRAIGRMKGGTECYVKKPKSTQRNNRDFDPTRVVHGSPKIREMWNRRYDRMAAELGEARPGITKDQLERTLQDLYVVGDLEGNYANPTVLGRKWTGYSQSLKGVRGRRPTFHALRDTHASLKSSLGVNSEIIAKDLGHQDPGFTGRTYINPYEEARRDSQAMLDEVL